jgi:rhodanese-related sulfurtransferase
MIASGEWVLLDVRRPDQHEEAHPQGVCVYACRVCVRACLCAQLVCSGILAISGAYWRAATCVSGAPKLTVCACTLFHLQVLYQYQCIA